MSFNTFKHKHEIDSGRTSSIGHQIMGYDINSVVMVGRLVRDPEIKTIGNDKTICQFSIASGDGKEKDGQDKTNFIDVTAWDKTAQFVGNYIRKGSQVVIKGKLKQDRWQDKKDGGNRSKISINA